jgi:hypothetical protein
MSVMQLLQLGCIMFPVAEMNSRKFVFADNRNVNFIKLLLINLPEL